MLEKVRSLILCSEYKYEWEHSARNFADTVSGMFNLLRFVAIIVLLGVGLDKVHLVLVPLLWLICVLILFDVEYILTGELNGSDLVDLRFYFNLDLSRFSWDLGLIWIRFDYIWFYQ